MSILESIQHEYAYQCGAIDAFNEIIRAGVKKLALSHPASQEEIEQVLPFAKEVCEKYGTHMEVEPELLITDLFPHTENVGKTVILFWKEEEVIQKYHKLKIQKEFAVRYDKYDEERVQIATEFGKLLSYSEESIAKFIENNPEKEVF